MSDQIRVDFEDDIRLEADYLSNNLRLGALLSIDQPFDTFDGVSISSACASALQELDAESRIRLSTYNPIVSLLIHRVYTFTRKTCRNTHIAENKLRLLLDPFLRNLFNTLDRRLDSAS